MAFYFESSGAFARGKGIIDLEALYREGGASTVSPDIERVLGRKPIAYEPFARDYASNF